MKKLFSMICALALSVSVLVGVGCSNKNADNTTSSQTSSTSVTSSVSNQTTSSSNQGVGGDGSQSGGKGYTRIDVDGVESESGNYLLFGSYPQSEVEDSEIVTTLTTKAGALPTNGANGLWTSYGYYKGTGSTGSQSNSEDYMWYIDMDYDNNGTKDYRGVYFTSYRPCTTSNSSSSGSTSQDDNGYYTSAVYWFKYEPIKWRILSESNGKALILCEMLIDSQEYNYTDSGRTIDGETVYASNYAHSSIRKWLNDNFYNTAFTDLQKGIIELTTVDNSASTTNSSSNQYACENTEDNIFLLSYQDMKNSSYGFSTSTTREKKPTAYAQCQGAYTYNGMFTADSAGNGYWWPRSPYTASIVHYVNYVGGFEGSYSVNYTNFGVSPALYIRL